MKNSLIICQWYVARILPLNCEKFPQATIFHYLDDILIATKDNTALQIVVAEELEGICKAGLSIVEDKIQQFPPWKYLGYRLTEHAVVLQNIQLQENPMTLHELHELQKLIGSVSWIQTLLGITNQDLAALFDLLRRAMDLNSPRKLTQEVKAALNRVSTALQTHQAHRCN